jgi:hypothetical protein
MRKIRMNVTDREHTVLCKALAYAIEAIEALPAQWQEWSDKEDMIELLGAISEHPEEYRVCARGHIFSEPKSAQLARRSFR